MEWGGQSWRGAVLDLLFERTCEGCGKALTEDEPGQYCWDCRAELPLARRPWCELCGDPVAGETGGEFLCGACAEGGRGFDWARSAMRYRGAAKRAVRAFKYHSALWLEGELATWLEAAWASAPEQRREAAALVPVPMHWTRQRAREYNQAELLARALAKRVGVPCRTGWLRRSGFTPTQTHLTARQRAENVRGRFRAGGRGLAGAGVVLVDDVMTTGATLSECAKALKAAGAAWVGAVTVARGG